MNMFLKKNRMDRIAFFAFLAITTLVLTGLGMAVYQPLFRWMNLHSEMQYNLVTLFFLNPVEIFIVVGLWKIKNRLIGKREVITPFTSEAEIYRVIHRIVGSDEFATALRPVLPKGEEDKRYGFDYIPFLLRNIDKRRLRFQKSSQLFLLCTLILAVVFSTILAGLGYILVDEGAAGDALRLKDIDSHLAKIQNAIPSLTPMLSRNEEYGRILRPIIDRIKTYEEKTPDPLEQSIKNEISNSLDQDNLGKIKSSLETWLNDKNLTQKKDFTALLATLQEQLNRFEATRKEAGYFVLDGINKLNETVVATGHKSVETNRTPELLKRMGIGFIVATFFLAILKYMSGLYRDHYRQMLQADQDDLAIRRFYIAFRSASEDKEQRTHVLSTFLAGSNTNASGPEKQVEGDFSPQSQELIKEILNVLAKKAGA